MREPRCQASQNFGIRNKMIPYDEVSQDQTNTTKILTREEEGMASDAGGQSRCYAADGLVDSVK